MSFVAEFAREIHERSEKQSPRPLTPLRYPSRHEKLYDIKAVVFDVYGTLADYWKPSFTDQERKMGEILAAFERTADFFGMTEFIVRMNPKERPERTLRDFYNGLIALSHDKQLGKGVAFPEVRIERVWDLIILMLRRHGYEPSSLRLCEEKDLSSCIAFYYHFHALGRGFYPGVVTALTALRHANFHLGIVSNAQFYTPIDLTLFCRDQSNNRIDDYLELFHTDLTFYSYEYGFSKPNPLLFRKLYDALYELHILPSQTVFVGNDLVDDIKPAADAGMLTAFFTGDDQTAFVHDQDGKTVPDISFASWKELPEKLSFYENKDA